MKTVKIPMLEEFKAFAMRGNVVDLAVGVIIGAAFNNIVNSLVKDVVMPPIGAIVGHVDFNNLYIPLGVKITQEQRLSPRPTPAQTAVGRGPKGAGWCCVGVIWSPSR